MTTLPGRVRSLLPDPLFYRAVAASYRLRPEHRLLFPKEFAPEGCTAVDIGGWWGPWTYWLSRRAAAVWSFEPNPELAAFLTRVVAANVQVENVALSDQGGHGTLFAPEDVGRDALATLSPTIGNEEARRIEVPLRRLDDYGLEQVGFIKIDVEGHEFQVLRGAEATLAHDAPTLLIEIDQALHEEPIQVIFDWLAERGYSGRLRRAGTWEPLSSFDVDADQLAHTDLGDGSRIVDFVFERRDA